MAEPHITRPISRFYKDERRERFDDTLITEEPLEIRVNQEPVTVTMRTPGHDLELAAGLLLAEGVIKGVDDILSIAHCRTSINVVRVELKPGLWFDKHRLERAFISSSSCGLCGKASLEGLERIHGALENRSPVPEPKVVFSLPSRLRERQTLFHLTGSSHSAALFNTSGDTLSLFEDIGRHNAVDKLLGHHLLNRLAIGSTDILCLSGRVSFEIMQKAISARIGTVVAVGAPSGLCVEMACSFQMNLIGFVGTDYFNVYA